MARGCDECGGIYMHQGMCSMLPADSDAGKRRDLILSQHTGNPAKAMKAYMERIIPEKFRVEDWDARWQAWADYCEQPSNAPAQNN